LHDGDRRWSDLRTPEGQKSGRACDTLSREIVLRRSLHEAAVQRVACFHAGRPVPLVPLVRPRSPRLNYPSPLPVRRAATAPNRRTVCDSLRATQFPSSATTLTLTLEESACFTLSIPPYNPPRSSASACRAGEVVVSELGIRTTGWAMGRGASGPCWRGFETSPRRRFGPPRISRSRCSA